MARHQGEVASGDNDAPTLTQNRRWARSRAEIVPPDAAAVAPSLELEHFDLDALLGAGPAAEDSDRAQRTRSGKDARAHRATIAHETLAILRSGGYWHTAEDETTIEVDISGPLQAAIAGSTHYAARGWRAGPFPPAPFDGTPEPLRVTCCTTLAAMEDLASRSDARMGVLNFASARNPGGGFTTGAEAQEESLARSSALYPCLMKHFNEFFVPNRNTRSGAYTHDLICTPSVPIIRDDTGNLLRRVYVADFVTAAAPNLGVMFRDGAEAQKEAETALRERITRVLHTFALHGAVDIVLGAWGCGVFKNDPGTVASLFDEQLRGAFKGRFRRVVFAVLDPGMAQIFTDVIVHGRRSPASRGGNVDGGKSKGKRGKQRDGKAGKRGY